MFNKIIKCQKNGLILAMIMALSIVLLRVHPTSAQTEFDCADVTGIPTIECETLIVLYNSMDGDNWRYISDYYEETYRDEWFQTTTPCTWHVIRCADGSISQLNFQYICCLDFRSGEGLPSEIGNLSNLTYLNLSNNNLTSLPAEIGNLSNLTQLYLSNNNLTSLPAEIGNLSNLTTLSLWENNLDTIPASIGNLSNLVRVYLTDSGLTSLPANILMLTSLKSFPIDEGMCTNGSQSQLDAWHEATGLSLPLCGQIPAPFSCADVTEISTIECEALVAIQEAAAEQMPSWSKTTTPCTWEGVTCSSGIVTELDLWYQLSASDPNAPVPTIPPEIGNFANLTDLDLSGNKLTSLPPEIGNLTNLGHLDLSDNNLTSLPPEIGNFDNLTGLYLFSNNLTTLPPEIGGLDNLVHLYLPGNSLTTLPAEIGNLVNLSNLILTWNNLTTLPAEIGNLTNLGYLELAGNQLTTLPIEMKNLASLTYLYLDPNPIEAIPLELMAAFSRIYLVRGLEIVIPDCAVLTADFTNIPTHECEALRLLQVDQNSSFDPCDWDRVVCNAERDHVVELDLRGWQGATGLPAEIGNFSNLTRLDLYRSGLTTLPPEIGNLVNLTRLDLRYNELTGLPAEIGHLTELIYLSLTGNAITTLSAEIGHLSNLTYLNLASNGLGMIPAEIGNLVNLKLLDLADNNLTIFPPSIGNLTNLTYLGLTSNKLDTIPAEIGNLVNLTLLKLGDNNLTSLSPEIGNLVNLNELNIYENQLTTLPVEMVNLVNLATLNLTDNPFLADPVETLPQKLIRHYYRSRSDLDIIELEITREMFEMVREDCTILTLESTNISISECETLLLFAGRISDGWLPDPCDWWRVECNTEGEHVTSLRLNNHDLTTLPPEIGNLINLTELHLNRNNLTLLPPEIGNLINLTELRLDYNNLTTLPAEMMNLIDLVDIALSGNPIQIVCNQEPYSSWEIVHHEGQCIVDLSLPNPSIEIIKTADRENVLPGDEVIYTYRVVNTGNVTLTNIVVVDDVLGEIRLTETTLAPDNVGIGTVIIPGTVLAGTLLLIIDENTTLISTATVTATTATGELVTDSVTAGANLFSPTVASFIEMSSDRDEINSAQIWIIIALFTLGMLTIVAKSQQNNSRL